MMVVESLWFYLGSWPHHLSLWLLIRVENLPWKDVPSLPSHPSAPRSSWYRHIVLDTAATQIDIFVQVYILESLHLPRQTQQIIWQKVSAGVVKHRLWIRLSGFKSQLCYMWASMSQFPSLWNATNNCTYLTELRFQPWFLTGSKYFRHLNHVLILEIKLPVKRRRVDTHSQKHISQLQTPRFSDTHLWVFIHVLQSFCVKLYLA